MDFQRRAAAVLPPLATALLERAGECAGRHGSRLLLVGGAVRDVLLERSTEDLDLVVEGSGEAFVERLAAALDATVEAASAFCTWRLSLPDGRRLDLAAARSERYLAPGALPTIAGGDLAADLARRDFSINAMAVELGPTWGEPIDLHGGRRDLERRILRSLHAGSFADDPTRILRGIELAQRLGFRFEDATGAAARAALADGALDTLSPARFRVAWRRSFGRLLERGEAALKGGLEAAAELGLWSALGAAQGDDAVFAARARGLARGLAEGGDEGIDGAELLLRTLAWSDAEVAARLAVRWAPEPSVARSWGSFASRLSELGELARTDPALEPSRVAAALARIGGGELLLLAAAPERNLRRLAATYRERVAGVRLAISGSDLLADGETGDRRVGAALAATLAARQDGLITAGEELEYARDRLRSDTE